MVQHGPQSSEVDRCQHFAKVWDKEPIADLFSSNAKGRPIIGKESNNLNVNNPVNFSPSKLKLHRRNVKRVLKIVLRVKTNISDTSSFPDVSLSLQKWWARKGKREGIGGDEGVSSFFLLPVVPWVSCSSPVSRAWSSPVCYCRESRRPRRRQLVIYQSGEW